MPYELKNKEGYTIGDKFASVEDAKRVVPRVREWRPDESRPMAWNGWLRASAPVPVPAVPAPAAEPDYKITFVRLRLT